MRYFFQLLQALKTLHEHRIIHRDLKCANVFLSGDKQTAILGDMNVSKILKDMFAETQTGTPYFASPEVWRCERYDSKTDIWSLGCVVFKMCNFIQPFQAPDIDQLFLEVQQRKIQEFDMRYSLELRAIVKECLCIDPKERPSAKELLSRPIFNQLQSDYKKKNKKIGKSLKKNNKGINSLRTIKNYKKSQKKKEVNLYLSPKFTKTWEETKSRQTLLQTIPGDIEFDSIARKLPASRYSLSLNDSVSGKDEIQSFADDSMIRYFNAQKNSSFFKKLFKKKLKIKASGKKTKNLIQKATNQFIRQKKKTKKLPEKIKKLDSRKIFSDKKGENIQRHTNFNSFTSRKKEMSTQHVTESSVNKKGMISKKYKDKKCKSNIKMKNYSFSNPKKFSKVKRTIKSTNKIQNKNLMVPNYKRLFTKKDNSYKPKYLKSSNSKITRLNQKLKSFNKKNLKNKSKPSLNTQRSKNQILNRISNIDKNIRITKNASQSSKKNICKLKIEKIRKKVQSKSTKKKLKSNIYDKNNFKSQRISIKNTMNFDSNQNKERTSNSIISLNSKIKRNNDKIKKKSLKNLSQKKKSHLRTKLHSSLQARIKKTAHLTKKEFGFNIYKKNKLEKFLN